LVHQINFRTVDLPIPPCRWILPAPLVYLVGDEFEYSSSSQYISEDLRTFRPRFWPFLLTQFQ